MYYGYVVNYTDKKIAVCLSRGEKEIGCASLLSEKDSLKSKNQSGNLMPNAWQIYIHAGTLYKLEYAYFDAPEDIKEQTFIIDRKELEKFEGPFEIQITNDHGNR